MKSNAAHTIFFFTAIIFSVLNFGFTYLIIAVWLTFTAWEAGKNEETFTK